MVIIEFAIASIRDSSRAIGFQLGFQLNRLFDRMFGGGYSGVMKFTTKVSISPIAAIMMPAKAVPHRSILISS